VAADVDGYVDVIVVDEVDEIAGTCSFILGADADAGVARRWLQPVVDGDGTGDDPDAVENQHHIVTCRRGCEEQHGDGGCVRVAEDDHNRNLLCRLVLHVVTHLASRGVRPRI